MPKLRPETQAARREHILDVALACFAKSGFHRTTMQDICKAASVSPGALYLYFDSKEALIEGLVGRDRDEFAERFAAVGQAQDFLAALNTLAVQYFSDEPSFKRLFVIEMKIEATRNPRIADIVDRVERFCRSSFADLFRRMEAEGRIAPRVSIETLVEVFDVMGDGLFWRRAIHTDFNVSAVLPAITGMLRELINPIDGSVDTASGIHRQYAELPDREQRLPEKAQ